MSTIVLMVEGATEIALKNHLKRFLDGRAAGQSRVRLATRPGVVTGNLQRLRHRVNLELRAPDVVGVVALIDAFPDFAGEADPAAAAIAHLRRASDDARFYPHVALYDVEAWLLPYWEAICAGLDVKQARPGGAPEAVDGDHPPSHRLDTLYRLARRKYVKQTEMNRILAGKDLTIAAAQCPQFKAFLNTLLTLANLEPLQPPPPPTAH